MIQATVSLYMTLHDFSTQA